MNNILCLSNKPLGSSKKHNYSKYLHPLTTEKTQWFTNKTSTN